MITKEITEIAELWFNDIRIMANKTNGVPVGRVYATGKFYVPDTDIVESTVRISKDVNEFLVILGTKLGVDPAIVYQGICDSLEVVYTDTLPVVE